MQTDVKTTKTTREIKKIYILNNKKINNHSFSIDNIVCFIIKVINLKFAYSL